MADDRIEEASNESIKIFKISGGTNELNQASNQFRASSFTVGNISAPSMSFKEELVSNP